VEATGSTRHRRGTLRPVTPEAVAAQIARIRDAASAFGVRAVAPHLEQAAQEALAVARTDEERELARQLLLEARRSRYGRGLVGSRPT
jgi:hypothetical protein